MLTVVSPVVCKQQNDNRIYLKISINNKTFMGLLDTGAQMSIISERLYRHFSAFDYKLQRTTTSAVTADNSPLKVMGMLTLPVIFKNVNKNFDFIVVPGLTSELILGMDFLFAFNLIEGIKHLFETSFNASMNEMTGKNDKEALEFYEVEVCVCSERQYINSRDSLNSGQEKQLNEIIKLYNNISSEQMGLGLSSLVTHQIKTTGDPIKQRYYPVSPAKLISMNEEVDRMLELGVIRPSKSPWSNPVVMITKKDGTMRFCVDCRKLNSVTVRDSYPLPRIQNILDNLKGARYLTTIDLSSAFWQIRLVDDSCEKTAFVVPQRGLFEFVRMPFGLTNAASEMQRLTDKLINHEFDDHVFGYIDDLVLCSPTFEHHLNLLKKVFVRLKEAGLTVNIKKCNFCKDELRYLGYIVDNNGLRADPEKLNCIQNFQIPHTAKLLRGFIGLCSYYRRFVKNFSTIVAPLTALIGKKKGSDMIDCNDDAKKAFTDLKQALVSAPVMAYPDFSLPFILQCDASSVGIGSVLTQTINGNEHPVAYYSRILTKTERNYSTTERELLAVLDSIKHFRCYLDGMKFSVVTDHMSLKWLLTLDNPTGRLARWATLVSQYTFDIIHRKGVLNVVPDALSRMEINLITYNAGLSDTNDRWYRTIFQGCQDHPAHFPTYQVRDNGLFKHVPARDLLLDGTSWKRVLPREKRHDAITQIHDSFGSVHPGVSKTYFKLKEDYFWPSMHKDVLNFLNNCEICKRYKFSNSAPRGQMNFPKCTSAPMQMLSIDLVGPLPLAYYGYRYILSVVDVFSKFVWLFSLRRADANSICKALESEIFLKFGIPANVICDNGSVFRSNQFREFINSYAVPKLSYTAYYTPQVNPVERYNQTIITCLSILIGNNNQRNWAKLLPQVQLYLNSCVNLATSYTPNFLMFGREVIVDASRHSNVNFPNSRNILNNDRQAYASRLNSLQDVYSKVADNLAAAFRMNAKHYNKGRLSIALEVGDVVWRRNFVRSTGSEFFSVKLAPRFVKTVVVLKHSNLVYTLKDFNGPHVGKYHIKDILKL